MDFKGQPFIDDCKFPFQPFDNTFADIAERSDIVGIDGYPYWAHPTLLYDCGCLPLSFSLTPGIAMANKTIYMSANITYITHKTSTYF